MSIQKVYVGGDDDKIKGPQLPALKAREHYELKDKSGWSFPQPGMYLLLQSDMLLLSSLFPLSLLPSSSSRTFGKNG